MGKYQVISMTVVAGGCYDQSRFKQTSSMYTLCVILNNIVFSDIIHPGYNFTFPVTFAAQERDVHFIGAGIWI